MVSKKKTLSLAIGSAFAAAVAAAPVANAADNPFAMDSLQDGYTVVADKNADAKCGEGRCGGGSAETKADANKGNANRTRRTSGR